MTEARSLGICIRVGRFERLNRGRSMTVVSRFLLAKRIRFRAGRRRDFEPPAIDAVLDAIVEGNATFRERHIPVPEGNERLPAGTRCAYIDNIHKRANRRRGVYFDVCSYTSQSPQDQINADFTRVKPDVISGPIVDRNGRSRDILGTIHCVALGEVLLVEASKGAGGLDVVAALLTSLARRFGDEGNPGIALEDVTGASLRQDIDRGGGVEKMVLRTTDGAARREDSFSSRLVDLRTGVGRSHRVTVQWDSGDDPLDADDVIAAMQDYQDPETSLSAIKLTLKDGQQIKDVSKYRERRKILVQANEAGRPFVTEIETALWNYLDELRRPDGSGWRLLDDHGYFQRPEHVELAPG